MKDGEVLRKSRVLLAEDDLPSQRLVRMILERRYDVTAVHSGVEAVDAYGRGEFDLVLLDLMMPTMNGFEAARRIRSLERESGKGPVPILAISAMVTQETRRECDDSQMNEFIAKPVEIDELCTVVQKYLH